MTLRASFGGVEEVRSVLVVLFDRLGVRLQSRDILLRV